MATLAERVALYAATVPEWRIAEELNAPDATLPTVSREVPAHDARRLLFRTGEWAALVIATTNTALTVPVRSAAVLFHSLLTLETTLDTVDPIMRARFGTVLGALLTAGILSADTRLALVALADRRPSWAEANGLPTITARDVGIARGARGGESTVGSGGVA
jgi:hypothetical protein